MKATVLTDNISHENLKGEWGLSIYIEYEGKNYLLDTGASGLFYENARKLNKDISKIDYAVLSHAHYDHADGMEKFFEINKTAKFYLQKSCEENCYKKKFLIKKYIGIFKGCIEKFKNRIVFVDGDYKLSDRVYLVPHKTENLEQIGKRESMYRKQKKGWKFDDFSHEQSLVFDTEKGLVIFNSCSHGGAANIINEVSQTFPDKKVYAIIGGFHLHNKTEKEVLQFAEDVEQTGIQYICTGHCTGQKAYDILKQQLGDKVHQLRVGLIIE